MAESNAHGYHVPLLKIDGEPAAFLRRASYVVKRVDIGQRAGAVSPGPTGHQNFVHFTIRTVVPRPTSVSISSSSTSRRLPDRPRPSERAVL